MRRGAAHKTKRKPERAPAWYIPRWQMTARRRYGTPGPSADSTVGGTSVCYARCSDARVPVASVSSNAAQISSVTSPRAPTPSVANPHRAVPAKGTGVSRAVPLGQGTISTTGTRALCAVPLGHGPNSSKGTRTASTVPLSRGINSATEVRVSKRRPLNHGKGACASRAAPPQPRVAQQRCCCDGTSPS